MEEKIHWKGSTKWKNVPTDYFLKQNKTTTTNKIYPYLINKTPHARINIMDKNVQFFSINILKASMFKQSTC